MVASDLTLLWHYVRKWAREKPDSEALVSLHERLTWTEFAEQVDRAAKAFLDIGVQKGDRVVLISMARNEFATTFMGASKIGATWLGLSPKTTLHEMEYILRDYGPRAIVTVSDYLDKEPDAAVLTAFNALSNLPKVLTLGERVSDVDDFAEFVNRPRPDLDAVLEQRAAEVDPDDPALVMYTAGPAGRPRGVVHTHKSIIANVASEIRELDLDADTKALLHFPINHVAGDVEIGFASIYAGATLVSRERFDPKLSLRTIEQEGITLVGQIPSMYLFQMRHPAFRDADLSKVRNFVISGSTPPKALIDTLAGICAKTGAHLIQAFGMTETAGLVTFTRPGDPPELIQASAGRVGAGIELRIVDDDRREVPDGSIGTIAFRGDPVMKDYLNDPEATAAVIDADGWLYTHDLAKKDAKGYIYVVGRNSEMFKSGGENVFPREIENVLETHADIAAAAVFGVPDAFYVEVGRAFVMLKPGAAVTEPELRAFCQTYLSNFKVPKHFEFRDQLPMLPDGTVDKKALKEECGL